MGPHGTAAANRDEVIGVDEAVDGRQRSALHGKAEQAFDRRLLLLRVDADLRKKSTEGADFRQAAYVRGGADLRADRLDLKGNLRPLRVAGVSDSDIAK